MCPAPETCTLIRYEFNGAKRYTCGANGSGQLGLEHQKMTLFLTPVKALYGLKVRFV
jgi:hypothetical protein